jgi:AraC-like DNA-binding protein
MVRYIIGNNLVKLKNNLVADSVVEYAKNNFDKRITLADAARKAGRSPTTITHLIKKIAGKNFKRLCIEIKLNKA